MKIIISLFILALSFESFSCEGTPEQYALEFIQEEMAGRRRTPKTHCLDQKNFKYIKPVHDPDGEKSKRPEYLAKNGSQKVLKMNLLSKEMGHYQAVFSVEVSEDGGKNWRTIQDSLEFFISSDKKRGCALLLGSPTVSLSNCPTSVGL